MPDLRGVRKEFGAAVAVEDLDLDVRPGEFLTLLGPSGCGKTTTLNMIAGFLTPDRGSILLDGQDVSGCPRTAATPRWSSSSTRCSRT